MSSEDACTNSVLKLVSFRKNMAQQSLIGPLCFARFLWHREKYAVLLQEHIGTLQLGKRKKKQRK
jgi:hypothetical protein